MQVHLIWFIFMFFLALNFLLLTLISISYSIEWLINFDLFSLFNLKMQCSFLFDWMSLSFLTIVFFISTIIVVYSYNYMSPYNKPYYFLWLTFFFILSMFLLVTSANFFFAMLGWDGLGLISFFLIVFYQSESSITSGSFTLMMNRIGDSFYLLTIVFLFYYMPTFTILGSSIYNNLVILMIILTAMTKSAIYPFSPWLPKAMAAPTPISALVHSSTLVTAGLFIMMRYHYVLYSSFTAMQVLLLVSLFTSFYAGVNALFESDLKRLVALSTLSHLGFICMAFSLGLLHLSFFHMLVHALFKSLLFMAMGDIFINVNHSQDLRYLSNGLIYTPFSVMITNISIMNLLGIPFLSGYFSKDLVLEHLNYTNSSIYIFFIIYLNVIFTYLYSLKILMYSFISPKVNPYQMIHTTSLLHSLLLTLLSTITLFAGYLFMDYIYQFIFMLPNPSGLKFLPLMMNISLFISLVLFLALPTVKTKLMTSYGSSMLFLSNICMTFFSNFYYNYMFSAIKSTELGFINYSFNNQLPSVINFVKSVIYTSLFKVQYNVLVFSFTFIMMLVFSLMIYVK